jgi:hypothetical protein
MTLSWKNIDIPIQPAVPKQLTTQKVIEQRSSMHHAKHQRLNSTLTYVCQTSTNNNHDVYRPPVILFLALVLTLVRFMLSLFATILSCILRLFAHSCAPFFMRIVARIMIATCRNVVFLTSLGRSGSATPVVRRRARSALLLLTELASIQQSCNPRN